MPTTLQTQLIGALVLVVVLGPAAFVPSILSVTRSSPVVPCVCPTFDLVQAFSVNDDGECLAFNRGDGQLYRFDGHSTDDENMQRIDISAYPPTVSFGPNLLPPPGNYPGGHNEVTACVWYPSPARFLVSSFDDTLYSMAIDGQSETAVGSIPTPTLRGFALVAGLDLYAIDKNNGEIYRLDPNTGATVSGPVQLQEPDTTSVRGWALAWDSLTSQTYVAYSRTGDDSTVRTIGRVNLSTGVVTEGCVAGTEAINSMTFDASGALWISTGSHESNPTSLFFMGRPPCDA